MEEVESAGGLLPTMPVESDNDENVYSNELLPASGLCYEERKQTTRLDEVT